MRHYPTSFAPTVSDNFEEMSKFLITILILLVLVGCNSKTSNDPIISAPQTNNLSEPKPERIVRRNPALSVPDYDVDISVKDDEWDEYFVSIKDSALSLCCLWDLYNPFEELTVSKISAILPEYDISFDSVPFTTKVIFSNGVSEIILKTQKMEYAENTYETYLGRGNLIDTSITLSNNIKIGMPKQVLMSNYFDISDSLAHIIRQISVSIDERGATHTKYRFENDKLVSIEFGSSENYK
jgi:hypothetical protein